MTLKWVYAAVVVAAALVLGLALRGGRPEAVEAGGPPPEPRVVGGLRADLPLEPRSVPGAPGRAADTARAPIPSAATPDAGELAGRPAAAVDVSREQIAAQTPIGERGDRTSAGASVSRPLPPLAGGGGGAGMSGGGSIAAAIATPEAAAQTAPALASAEPVVPDPVVTAASPPPEPAGPAPPDLGVTPAEQQEAVLELVEGENAKKQQTARDLVGPK